MKRTIIPTSNTDRGLVVSALVCAIAAIIEFAVGYYWLATASVAVAMLNFFLAYVFQEQPEPTDSTADYTTTIAGITGIVAQLANLNTFLQRERARIAETEATVKQLSDEKAKLEPVILTQRQTVEAILSAHAARAAKNIWKERVLGFVFGIAASLAASFVYEYIRR